MRRRIRKAAQLGCLLLFPALLLFSRHPHCDVDVHSSDDVDIDLVQANREYRQIYAEKIITTTQDLSRSNNYETKDQFVDDSIPFSSKNGCIMCPDVTAIIYADQARHICNPDSGADVLVVLMIMSHVRRIDTRDMVRQTWASASGNNTGSIRHVFVMGKPRYEYLERMYAEEEKRHRDLIMLNVYEDYKNLTYKVLGALKWANGHCQNARFIMKADDDTYINTAKLPELLLGQDIEDDRLMGSCHSLVKPIRDKDSKWYVSPQLYQPEYFKPYCQGPGYIMGRSLARDIVNVAQKVPFIPMEDAYIGLCVHELGRRVKSLKAFFMSRPVFQDEWIKLCNLTRRNTIVFHTIYAYELPTIFKEECEMDWKDKKY